MKNQLFAEPLEFLKELTTKGNEIFIEGKLPFERKEGWLSIYFWRVFSLIMIALSTFSLMFAIRSVYKVSIGWTMLENIFFLPMIIMAVVSVLLFFGAISYKLISQNNPPYEFGIVMKPLVLVFLAVWVASLTLSAAMYLMLVPHK